jgi:2-phosphosulfolactate phosphatase
MFNFEKMNISQTNRSIEICFTPVLFKYKLTTDDCIVVIVDILRATTAICTAFNNGAEEIIPVSKIEDTRAYRPLGYMVAGERDGVVIDGADFGNSPFNFTKEKVNGKKLAITTTNGTQTIEIAKESGCVVLGAFSNISVLQKWLEEQNKNVVILCSGWKNKFNVEDSAFAGALAERLLNSGKFISNCDSVAVATDIWKLASDDVLLYMEKASHRHRLKKLGLDDVLAYCFTDDTCPVIPFLKGNALVNVLR